MVKVNCVSLSTVRIVKFAPPFMLIVCPIPPTNTLVNCELTPVTMGEEVEHVTVVGFTPLALLSINAVKLATILSWLCTVDDDVLKVHFQPVPRITVMSDDNPVPNAAQLK